MWSWKFVQPSFLPAILSSRWFAICLRLHLLLIIVLGPPEQKDMRFRRMNLVMDPTQTLLDADSSPFVVCEEAKGARIIVGEVALRDELEERLWEDHMSILVLFV